MRNRKELANRLFVDDMKRGIAYTAAFALLSGGSLVEATICDSWTYVGLSLTGGLMFCGAALHFGKTFIIDRARQYTSNPEEYMREYHEHDFD